MPRVFVITGTPGGGKTTLANALSKRLKGSTIIHANELIKGRKLFSSYSRDGARIVKMRALKREMENEIRKGSGIFILEGHVLCDISIKGAVAIVVREHLDKIKSRLLKRRYPIAKARENIVSEAIDYCGAASRRNYAKTFEIMSGKNALGSAIRIVKGGGKPGNEIDLLGELGSIIKRDKRFAI